MRTIDDDEDLRVARSKVGDDVGYGQDDSGL